MQRAHIEARRLFVRSRGSAQVNKRLSGVACVLLGDLHPHSNIDFDREGVQYIQITQSRASRARDHDALSSVVLRFRDVVTASSYVLDIMEYLRARPGILSSWPFAVSTEPPKNLTWFSTVPFFLPPSHARYEGVSGATPVQGQTIPYPPSYGDRWRPPVMVRFPRHLH